MNFLDQLKSLDPKDPGRWPLAIRAFFVATIFVALAGVAWYLLVWNEDRPLLQKAESEEQDLRTQFETKQQRAANLDAYKVQLAEMEKSFGAMLRQLPGRTEVPNLLVDISQTGLAAGLEEKLFQPSSEQSKGFYAELPIKIRLVGSYHEFGTFISGIAALPRIVTLHDIEIKSASKDAANKDGSFDNLIMELTAKTYRYLDDDSGGGVEQKVVRKKVGSTT